MKRLLVTALERTCGIIDRLPLALRSRYGCQLANASARLDDRWGTGVWR